MRTILVSRSSREKPKPLDKWVRTTSPSRMVTCRPCSISMTVRMSAMVLLPALGKPVNQTQKPCLPRAGYAELRISAVSLTRWRLRTSDFGLLSAFGLRSSAFPPHEHLRAIYSPACRYVVAGHRLVPGGRYRISLHAGSGHSARGFPDGQ